MDANWIFGLLAILILLDYVYKQVVGRSFHHVIARPLLWSLVIVSSISAACCFALAWHTYTARDFLLVGSSSFWLLLGIFLTGLAIAWLLPAAPDSDKENRKTRAPGQKQPLLPRNSMARRQASEFGNGSHPGLHSVSETLTAVPPAHSSPFSPSSTPLLTPLAARQLPPSGASPQMLFPQSRQPVGPMALLSSAALARPRGAPQMLVITLMAFALLAVGWQLGHIFALSQNESSVAIALPIMRATPSPTPIVNASLTERLMAQTIGNAPVAAPTSQPQLQPTPTAVHMESVAFANTPVSSRSTTLKAKPAFEVEDANELPAIAFRRGDKSTTKAPAMDLPSAPVPVGGATARGYYESQSPAIRLLEPADGMIARDFVTMRWSADFELPPEQHYEVVAWLEDQEPFKQGISLAPLTSADHVRVNLALLDQALGPRFNPGIYRWGVMLVQRSPYQRIALLSNAQTLYYVPVE